MSAHTPGPWSYRAEYNGLKDEIGVKGRAICTVWVRQAPSRSDGQQAHRCDPWPEGEANARLIAQAPAFYAAAVALLAAAAPYMTHRNHAERDAYAALREAIAKADGSAS